MSYRGSGYGGGGFLGFPPAISQLVLINAVVFLLQPLWLDRFLTSGLALVPTQLVTKGMVWELVTYMFLHGGLMHLAFNMFGLVIFGADLERWWGSRDFLKYYFVTGVGAGIVHVITTYAFGNPMVPTIGASGAIFGILLAYGMAFPNRQVLLWFVIPVSARTLVIIFGFFELAMAAQHNPGDGVARFAHLGGMLAGFIYLRFESLSFKARRLVRNVRGQVNQARSGRGPSESNLNEEMDRILEKISRDGMGALTPEEKRTLAESAERARRRQRGEK